MRPINNNARYRDPSKTITALVLKAARKFITISIDGRESKLFMHPDGRPELHDSFNGGFRVFESEQAALDYDESIRLARILSQNFKFQSDFEKFPPSILLEVAKLLNVDTAKKEVI